MKKFTLLLCLFVASVMMPQWALADAELSDQGNTLTITTTENGQVNGMISTLTPGQREIITKIVLVGYFNSEDLNKISQGEGFSAVTTVDMSQAKFLRAIDSSNNYFLFHSEAGSAPYSGSGAKAYANVGDNLLQYNLIYEKNWRSFSELGLESPSSADFTYLTQEEMIIDKENRYNYQTGRYPDPSTSLYRQMIVTNESWSGPVTDNDGVNLSSVPLITEWGENAINSHKSEYANNDKIKFKRYYRFYENYNNEGPKWVLCSEEEYNSTSPQFIEIKNVDLNHWKTDGFSDGAGMWFYVYYTKSDNREWSEPGPYQATSIDGLFYDDERNNNEHLYNRDYTNGTWVKMYTTFYYFRLVQDSEPTGKWVNCSYEDGNERAITFLFADDSEKESCTTAQEAQYAIVGGTEVKKMYDGSQWIDFTSSTELTDYSQIDFKKWSGSLVTAILPNNVVPANCPNNIFKGCNQLTEVKHFVNNVAKSAKISWEVVPTNETPGVVEVEKAEEEGLFKLLVNSDSYMFGNEGTERFASGTVFWFRNGCSQLSGTDLAGLAGNMKDEYSDVKLNKFYVDLFDVPVASPSTIETAINDAISIMRERDWQYRGLLFPGNLSSASTQVIKDREKQYEYEQNKATCSEFVGYNKKNNTITTMHIYSDDRNANASVYETRFAKLKSMMEQHPVIASNTTSYLVSTNSPSEFDTSLPPETKPDADVILAVNDDMVNPVPGSKAGVSVTLGGAGHFATLVANTGIKDTPVDSLKITGNVNSDDISAVSAYVDGPRVLNLKAAVPTETIVEEQSDGFDDKAMLETLENNKIEFIILDAGKSKDVVCSADTSKLKSLKAVISSNKRGDANPALVAYVNVPGSLAEARCLATGNSGSGSDIHPTPQGLTSVTLAGRLYLSDISVSSSSDALYHPDNQPHTITTLDLENAVFVNRDGEIDCSQMNFNGAKYSNGAPVLRRIILPTDPAMTTITDNCFQNIGSLTDICIPYNYTHIRAGAFIGTNLKHITTTDDYNGAVVDNGDYTYTFSANLQQLGSSPDGAELFPANKGVTEVYSLATKVPKCYKNTFPYNFTFGYGGFDPTMVYCREKYHNLDGEKEEICVLRFPSKESYDNMPAELKEPNGVDASFDNNSVTDGYTKMVMKYTDPYRVYSKKDQTGAVDANGNAILWPTRTEMNAAFDMASVGKIWKDYTYTNNGNNFEEIEKHDADLSQEHYNFTDYIGWHQITLTQATYVDSKEHVVADTIKRYYEQAGWFTFCIPYNLTYSQVVKMMGIPMSRDSVKSYLGGTKIIGENGVITYEGGTLQKTDIMPDIRQLESVTRTKGSGGQDNTIVFRLTTNLADPTNKTAKYMYFEEDTVYYKSTSKPVWANQKFDDKGKPIFNEDKPDLNEDDDPICLVGGRPYIIRPYKRLGETISKRNLGMYIMKRYADEFSESASCVNSGPDYCEQLKSYQYDGSNNIIGSDDNEVTMRFAKPYEKHKVQAIDGTQRSVSLLSFTDEDKVEHRYYYTMIGQFWEQNLPEFCVYMSGDSWYRYFDTSLNFKWSPYKCVIMATPEINSAKIEDKDKPENDAVMPLPDVKAKVEGTFRDVQNCYFPINHPGTKDLVPAPLKLTFIGRNDHIFANQGPAGPKPKPVPTRYIFTMGDDEMIVDNGDDATAVKAIDMLDGEAQVVGGDTRVYSISGQYMGNSTDGLSKGVYIVGGRKIVVNQ